MTTADTVDIRIFENLRAGPSPTGEGGIDLAREEDVTGLAASTLRHLIAVLLDPRDDVMFRGQVKGVRFSRLTTALEPRHQIKRDGN